MFNSDLCLQDIIDDLPSFCPEAFEKNNKLTDESIKIIIEKYTKLYKKKLDSLTGFEVDYDKIEKFHKKFYVKTKDDNEYNKIIKKRFKNIFKDKESYIENIIRLNSDIATTLFNNLENHYFHDTKGCFAIIGNLKRVGYNGDYDNSTKMNLDLDYEYNVFENLSDLEYWKITKDINTIQKTTKTKKRL